MGPAPAAGRRRNSTIHTYNIVPLRSGRYVAVSGPTGLAPGPLAELNAGSHAAETALGSEDDDGSSALALVLGAQGSRPPGAVALIASLA